MTTNKKELALNLETYPDFPLSNVSHPLAN